MTLVREYQPTFVLGDGVTKEFSYLFEEVSENFIKVIVKHDDESTYVPVYSVDLDSHKVVFGDSEPAPLDTDVICIYRETPDLQDTPFRTLQGYDAKALENILTKIVAMIQELKANGFSTQILQGYPWQLDLLNPVDDSASVVIDYNARILKKGLYFRIQGGNLQVSSDGNGFITMPKSADILEFRQQHIVYPDLTTDDYLEYRIGNQWFPVTADFDTKRELLNHTSDTNNPHQVTKDQVGLGNCDNTADADKPISSATQDALDDLQDEIDSLKGLGRFLSVWNCATGLAETNPPESPYTYNSGDYFLVGTVDSTTNYKPDGATYTTGVASTTVETNSVKVNDVYIYDGTTWKLQENSQRTVTFSAVAGSPYDNTNLASALNAKANATDIPTVNNPTITLTQGGVTKGSFTLNQASGDTIDLDAGGGGGLPDQTGQAGKFLTTDGTDASWSDKPLVNKATGANSIGIGDNVVATRGSSVLIGNTAQTGSAGSAKVVIGESARATGNGATAVGQGSVSSGSESIAIGQGATASANGAVQIKYGTNSTANTLQVGSYQLMSADGTIPEARLASTTGATQGQVLTLDSNLDATWATPTASVAWGGITGTLSDQTDLQSALDAKANVALDNLTSAGKEVCANMAMPSSNTQAITVGASGATYTAPADGYVVFTGMATAAGQFVYIGSPTFDNVAFQSSAVGNGEYIVFTIPVSKGQVFTVNYNLGGTKSLNFVYANGAQ